MFEILKPEQGVLFMKVGVHAKETLEEIVDRKMKEIRDAGYAMWGYGGNTCHPCTIVQPFANKYAKQGKSIYLCMESMDSKHFAEPKRAEEFSVDGVIWQKVPDQINVRGSRYALKIKDLQILKEPFNLDLAQTEVAEGPSAGKKGDKYIQGHVDKACFKIIENTPEILSHKNITISLTAELDSPYAVFVK